MVILDILSIMGVFDLESIWSQLEEKDKQEYIFYLQVFGALSGLFKDNKEGSNANKPYLYYRNHEKLFAKVFDVEDLTRKDSAFDAIAKINNQRIGIGLKTWIHTRNKTFQKVAEFNKLAPLELTPLVIEKDYRTLVQKVSEFRNNRIEVDKRQYGTTSNIYHNVTRDNNVMNILETSYDLIQLDSINLTSQNGKTFSFTDGTSNYKFYSSKSVLLQEFDASEQNIITSIPITQYDDPFELLREIKLPEFGVDSNKEVIFLPLYSDRSYEVQLKSGFNAWNGASKSKGSGILRPDFEAYLPIPKWIHQTFPNFFGFNALNKLERDMSSPFTLHFPDDKQATAIITQDEGKSLQTNPQSFLGEWVLRDVLGLKARELLTIERLYELGVDSLRITKIDNFNFKIELAETYAFEKWKVEIEDKIISSGATVPTLRPDLYEFE